MFLVGELWALEMRAHLVSRCSSHRVGSGLRLPCLSSGSSWASQAEGIHTLGCSVARKHPPFPLLALTGLPFVVSEKAQGGGGGCTPPHPTPTPSGAEPGCRAFALCGKWLPFPWWGGGGGGQLFFPCCEKEDRRCHRTILETGAIERGAGFFVQL